MKGKAVPNEVQTCGIYQLDIAIEACIPPIANKLKNMGIRDFKELYHFGVQVKADLNLSTHE